MAKIRDARLPVFASFFAIYYAFTFLFQEKMCPISVRQNQKKMLNCCALSMEICINIHRC